ncbi:nucleolar protein [Coemansia erecta]|nr:nucleolar protein [Coemansia erecta]KAJ2862293.1 nucleolar protein [Coemansia asiatica]
MAPANKKAATAKASSNKKTAPKATAKSMPKTTKQAPVAKAASKKNMKKKTAAPAVVEKKKSKKEEPESEKEEEEEEEEEEETIYEEVSDDSAIEDASASSEEENDIDGESADEQEKGDGFVKLEEGSDDSEDEVDERALLAGIESSDEATDYSDNEDEDAFKANVAKISLKGKTAQMGKVKVGDKKKNEGPGVIYVGRIPHGFYEEEMRGYFSQFGDIISLRLSRNPKTGNSRHYGFIRFKYAEVARIVADTMNNYLLFDRLLKCVFIPPHKVHPGTFTHKVFKINRDTRFKEQIAIRNKERTPEEEKAHVEKAIKRENKLRRKLAKAGIDYDFPGYKKAKHVEKEEKVEK